MYSFSHEATLNGNRYFLSALLLTLLCLPGPLLAQGWSDTFSSEVLNTYLAGEKELRFMVVGAGSVEGTPEAVNGFIQALQSSAGVGLVMNSESLGDIAALSDADIVSKASPFPINKIAILRVFYSGQDRPNSVVVTIYEPSGALNTAIAGTEGQVLAAKSNPQESPSLSSKTIEAQGSAPSSESEEETAVEAPAPRENGAPNAAIESVLKVKKARSEAEEEYEKAYLSLGTSIVTNAYGGQVGMQYVVYRGKYQEPVSALEFFQLCERDDYIEQYKKGLETRNDWFRGAAGLSVVGVGFYAASFVAIDNGSGNASIITLSVGSLAGLIASGLAVKGLSINPVPTDKSENLRLVDEYNQGLRQSLGLEEANPTSKSQKRFSLRFHGGPLRGGAAFGINGTF